MSATIPTLLEDIRLLGTHRYELVQALRRLIGQTVPGVSEQVKYGGIVFACDVHFCGVFAYRQHVTIEFGSGARIVDPLGHLQGSGKGRRHLKLRTLQDIEELAVARYLPLALQAARDAG